MLSEELEDKFGDLDELEYMGTVGEVGRNEEFVGMEEAKSGAESVESPRGTGIGVGLR